MAESSGWSNFAAGASGFGGSLVTGIGNRRALKHSQQNFNRQLEWQEHMSNTAHQREVKDLIAAGLNPMLSVMGGSGASTPSAPNVGVVNEGAGVAESFQRGIDAVMQRKLIQANIDAVGASEEASAAQARKTNAEADILKEQVPYSGVNAQRQSEMLIDQARKLSAEAQQAVRGLDAQNLTIDQQEKLQPLVVEYQRLLNKAQELGIPEKQATAEFFEKVPASKWITILRQLAGK